MKIKEGFVLRQVMGNNVIIAVGEASRDFHKMVQLNDSAAEIWNYISNGFDHERIVDEMMSKYEVDRKTLEADVEKTINMFAENGMLEL